MSYVTSMNYDDNIPLDLPKDVVQWRLEIPQPEEMAYLHLARGNGVYEVRYMKEVNNRYVPAMLVEYQKEGGDGATVFIEWEKHFGEK